MSLSNLLQKFKCEPSKQGLEWAKSNWKKENEVIQRIEQLQKEQRHKKGKGEGIICSVLGACLSCAQEEQKGLPTPYQDVVSELEKTKLLVLTEELRSKE